MEFYCLIAVARAHLADFLELVTERSDDPESVDE